MANVVSVYGSLSEGWGKTLSLAKTLSVDESVHYPRWELAGSSTDAAISFGPVTTASVLFIKSDIAVTYKLSGGTDTHSVTANSWHLLMGTSVTSLTMSEAAGSTAILEIYIGGT